MDTQNAVMPTLSPLYAVSLLLLLYYNNNNNYYYYYYFIPNNIVSLYLYHLSRFTEYDESAVNTMQ